MKIPPSIQVVDGEAQLYVVASGEYDFLVFETYGSVHIAPGPPSSFGPFAKRIKKWKVGNLANIQDVPNNPGVRTRSNDAGVDTSFSVE